MTAEYKARCKMAEEAYKVLTDGGVYGDVEPQFHGFSDICVEIHWGDWKHEHLRCDWLLEGLGFELVSAEVTEDDGSDCYSALRYYRKAVA